MSDKQPNLIPENVVDMMVRHIFKKNGVKPEEVKNNISAEQKEMLKEMVEDLKKQVEDFKEKNIDESSE